MSLWAELPLEVLLSEPLANGRSVQDGTGFPVLRLTALRNGVFDFSECKHGDWSAEAAARFRVSHGDVLVVRGNGSIHLVGRAGFVKMEPPAVAFPDTMIRVRVRREQILPQFLAIQWEAPRTRKQIEQAARTTAGIFKVSQGDLHAIRLMVPPLRVQERVVSVVETQFSRLDAATASLGRAKANLKRARASVLKAAVEGRLVPTEAALARSTHRDYEPASRVLARSLAARRAKWPESGKGKFREPAAPEGIALTPLPEGWSWAALDGLAAIVCGIAKDSSQSNGRSVPYLRVANVQRGRLNLEEVKSIIAPDSKIDAIRLQVGDILLNEGGDRDKLGRGWVWNGEIPECIHQNHVFRARLWLEEIYPKYISHYANTQGDRYFADQGKQTTNLASISLSTVKALPVALPPIAEQERILAEVDRRLSVLDALELAVTANLTRCARLRQSILKRAFEGRLVPLMPATGDGPNLQLSPPNHSP